MAIINALPENLQKLFAPRPPLDYIPVPGRKKHQPYSGVASFAELFEDPNSTDNLTKEDFIHVPTREQKKKRKQQFKQARQESVITRELEKWNPKERQTGDPFHTIFVARLNYDTTEDTLRKEFEYYGPIKSCTIVKNTITGKSRGYAFIEYERERDMKSAYKQADGTRIDGHKVIVDMERGRTVSSFKPRRLGGGIGNTRRDKLPKRLLPPPVPERREYRGGSGRRDSYRRPSRESYRERSGSYRGPSRDNHRDDRRRRDYSRDDRSSRYGYDRDRDRDRGRDRYGSRY